VVAEEEGVAETSVMCHGTGSEVTEGEKWISLSANEKYHLLC